MEFKYDGVFFLLTRQIREDLAEPLILVSKAQKGMAAFTSREAAALWQERFVGGEIHEIDDTELKDKVRECTIIGGISFVVINPDLSGNGTCFPADIILFPEK